MAHLPVIADVFRVALNWQTSGGQIAANVIHIKANSGTPTAGDIAEVLDDSAGSDLWLPVSNSASVVDLAITPLDGVSATAHFAPATPARWVGGQAGDFSPATAAIVKLTTPFRGRSHRGRVFLPFIAESVMSNGILNGATATSVQTEWVSFDTNLNADADTPCHLVVASYKLATTDSIAFITCETALATQRRRQGRLRGA